MIERHRNPNGSYDGIGVMSDLTRLSRESVQEIWDKAKANHALLEACSMHRFEPLPPARPLKLRYRCSACQGEIGATEKSWYDKGRAHGLLEAAGGEG